MQRIYKAMLSTVAQAVPAHSVALSCETAAEHCPALPAQAKVFNSFSRRRTAPLRAADRCYAASSAALFCEAKNFLVHTAMLGYAKKRKPVQMRRTAYLRHVDLSEAKIFICLLPSLVTRGVAEYRFACLSARLRLALRTLLPHSLSDLTKAKILLCLFSTKQSARCLALPVVAKKAKQ